MGDEDHGRAQAPVQLRQLQPRAAAQRRIQVGQRLVEEEDRRLLHHRAADRHALPLAAGELPRLARQQRVELQHPRRFLDAAVDLGLGQLDVAQAEGQVVAHRHVRIQRVVLEHHGQLPQARRRMGDVLPADQDASGRHFLQPGDHAQQAGLAAARRAEEHDELARRHVERQVGDDLHRAIALADLLQLEGCQRNVS